MKAELVVLISGKIDFRTRKISTDKGRHYNRRTNSPRSYSNPKCVHTKEFQKNMKQKLIELKRETDTFSVTLNPNIPLAAIDKTIG